MHIEVDSYPLQEAENLWFPVAEHPSGGRGYREGDTVDIAHIRLQPPGEPEMTPRGIATWMATHPPALETCLIRKKGQDDAVFLQDVWRAAGRFCKQYGQQVLAPLGGDALTLAPAEQLH